MLFGEINFRTIMFFFRIGPETFNVDAGHTGQISYYVSF